MRECKRKSVEERFWPKVAKSDGCWEWTASKSQTGYGQIMDTVLGKPRTAPRVAWELVIGPIPAGLHVLHRCDNRGCVRPDHLFLGTHWDNMVDRTAKHRMPHGETHSRSKISAEQARLIHQRVLAGEPHRRIAADFGITQSSVSRIGSGETWRLETAGQ